MKYLKILVFVLLALACLKILCFPVNAQNAQVTQLFSISGTSHASCMTPTTSSICLAGDGLWLWNNSTTGWFQVVPQAAQAQGVTSLTVCNAAGTVCTSPATGAVSVNIPKGATVSVTDSPSATVTLQ